MDLLNRRNQRLRDPRCEHVVDLADMRHRVLTGGGLQAHRAARGDQAVHSVAAADLAVISGLGRCRGHREVHDPSRRIVGGIDRDPAARKAMLACEYPCQFFGPALLGMIILEVTEMPSDHCARDGELDRIALPNTHHLDDLPPRRIDAGAVPDVDAAFDGQNQSFQSAQGCMADADRRVVGGGMSARARREKSIVRSCDPVLMSGSETSEFRRANPLLDFVGALDRVNDAVEHDEQSVACYLDDTLRFFAIVGSINARRWVLRRANVPVSSTFMSLIANHVGREYRHEFALNAWHFHKAVPRPKNRI